MALKIMIKYFVGVIFVISCKRYGMLSIGNIKPDNNSDGKSEKKVASVNATCWESAITEIRIPTEVHAARKIIMLMNNNQ